LAEKINKQKAIQVLEDPVEAVRKLRDVYIGQSGNPGYMNMLREIIQNSLDEIIKGNTLDKNIIISFDERNYTCIVEDNGQGIDLAMLEKVFSVLHSSSNYDKKEGSGEYSSGKNGMGATITNFLSRFFVVESYRMDGTAARVEFEEGHCKKGTKKIKCPPGKHGVITSFAPSSVMGEITVTCDDVEHLIWTLVHLCLTGTRVVLNCINKLNQKKRLVIENKNGIYDMINVMCDKNVIQPIYFVNDNGTMKVEAMFTYDTSMDEPAILSFANMCPTTGGTHVKGFISGITKYFRDYMNKIYLANNKKLQVNAADISCGLRVVLSAFHVQPLFTGQSKEVLSKDDIAPFIADTTVAALEAWAAKNPADLQKVSKYLKDVCEIRMKSDKEKVKMSDKYTASSVTGYPAKYKKPNSNKDFEVWLCEGDSACSGMENNRDKETQGLFPLRGKIINVLTSPTKKVFENEEISGMFKIFGYSGYSKKFDPEKFRPSKVVIATDADADGMQ
jgi:DNA gyrase/topoisomerase IV subunit B